MQGKTYTIMEESGDEQEGEEQKQLIQLKKLKEQQALRIQS